jgi:hypothetical protein
MPNVDRIGHQGSDIAIAGIVLSRTPYQNFHVGIGHRTPGGPLRILHLAWDCDMRDDPDPCPDVFCSPFYIRLDIDPEDEDVLAGLCRRISSVTSKRGITFSIGTFPAADSFFDYTGLYRSSHPLIGLSCASFVIKVFDAADLKLVQLEGWPLRPQRDEPAQRGHVMTMERILLIAANGGTPTTITDEKIEFNRRQIGLRPRVAPEEAAGAALEPQSDWPVTWQVCEANGEMLAARSPIDQI